jgi:hypothetical protein
MRETIMLSFLAVLLCVNAFHRGMVPRSLRFMTFQSDRVTGAPTRLAGGKVDLFSGQCRQKIDQFSENNRRHR